MLHRLNTTLYSGMAGEHDNFNIRALCFHLLQGLDAVNSRHCQVDHCHIYISVLHRSNGFCPTCNGNNVEPSGFQTLRHEVDEFFLIIY